ncbi:MAG: cell wall metabolism sensor histidine kinase WalK [Oscillospiraceae bacterium]|nr:cell wall metabolism sensor histidine kinase WalK [Oscillospiraceae bacterium]
MFRSLHMKLVLIMVLLITSLMTIVGAFMMTSITSFYIDEFYQQIESVFGASNPSNTPFVSSLRSWTAEGNVLKLQEMIEAKAGDLGLNSNTRNYYILDGRTGAFLAGSDGQDAFDRLQSSPNLLAVRSGIASGDGTVGDQSDIASNYMDVAIPITGGENAYIIYIYDNRDTVSALNGQLFVIILQALLVGLLISVLLSFLLSKTMIIPIERLTEGAERVAAGDFSDAIAVESTDEIGILTTTFNDMAEVLQDTLEAVENERNKLDTLFLHMTDGVVSFAGDGTVLTSNPAASSMLGREVAFYDYDALFGEQAPLQKVMALQRPNFVSGELHVGRRILELYLAPVSDEAGGAMAVLHDVTAQRKNDEMRKEFVANVSHELRTPLTNVRSYAETLRYDSEIPREIAESFLDIVISETDRMTRIVQDLLTLSRLDSGRADLRMSRFPLVEAIESVCRAVELDAQKHSHTLVRQYGSGITLPVITGDRSRLEQVMMNVIGNAIKYTPDGGTISVDAGITGQKVWIEVADNGIGIPQQDRERIFDRFYRVDKARSREKGGTGLGLSIAKEIVLRHHGTISLGSHDGPGCTVRIVLPVRQEREGELL